MVKLGVSAERNNHNFEGHLQMGYSVRIIKKYYPLKLPLGKLPLRVPFLKVLRNKKVCHLVHTFISHITTEHG